MAWRARQVIDEPTANWIRDHPKDSCCASQGATQGRLSTITSALCVTVKSTYRCPLWSKAAATVLTVGGCFSPKKLPRLRPTGAAAKGHKRTRRAQRGISALPPKADTKADGRHVRFGPTADMTVLRTEIILSRITFYFRELSTPLRRSLAQKRLKQTPRGTSS
jgi:hypothetical protein